MTTQSLRRRFDLLGTPLFAAAIALLVLNDFVLKVAFHNALTGKLSDFAGLVAFTLFGCAIWPKGRWIVATASTIGFIYWKSPYSQTVIDFANAFLPIPIGRTVDYTDLIALPVIWLVCHVVPKMRAWPVRSWLLQAFAVVSLVALTATSWSYTHNVRQTVDVPIAKDESSIAKTEKELEVLFDTIAEKYGLPCTVCEPLSSGRLYAIEEEGQTRLWRSLYLTANFDPKHARVFYYVLTQAYSKPERRVDEVDAIRAELETELRSRFPGLTISEAKWPKRELIRIAVRKKKGIGSDDDVERQKDHERALAIVDEIVRKRGLKRWPDYHWPLYYAGRLYGPYPFNRELTVEIRTWHWVRIDIDRNCRATEYAELQQSLAGELTARLQAEFGERRVRIR